MSRRVEVVGGSAPGMSTGGQFGGSPGSAPRSRARIVHNVAPHKAFWDRNLKRVGGTDRLGTLKLGFPANIGAGGTDPRATPSHGRPLRGADFTSGPFSGLGGAPGRPPAPDPPRAPKGVPSSRSRRSAPSCNACRTSSIHLGSERSALTQECERRHATGSNSLSLAHVRLRA